MDMGTIGASGGAAGVAVAVFKLAEKIPWGRLFGRPSKNGKGMDKGQVLDMIGDHQAACPVRDSIEQIQKDIREIRGSVTEILLNGRG